MTVNFRVTILPTRCRAASISRWWASTRGVFAACTQRRPHSRPCASAMVARTPPFRSSSRRCSRRTPRTASRQCRRYGTRSCSALSRARHTSSPRRTNRARLASVRARAGAAARTQPPRRAPVGLAAAGRPGVQAVTLLTRRAAIVHGTRGVALRTSREVQIPGECRVAVARKGRAWLVWQPRAVVQ